MRADMCQTPEELEALDAEIGMREDPEQIALEDLRRYQEEMGLTFENPDAPVEAPEDGRVPGWMTQDEEFR